MASGRAAEPLHLRAADAQDVTIFAAHIQDATVRVGDMAYLAPKRRFALMLNRFMWEDLSPSAGPHADADAPYRRTRTALHFDGVLSAKTQNLDLADKHATAMLLTLEFAPGADDAGVLSLVFSGGGAIQLQLECVDAWLTDMGKPWPTKNLPQHDGGTGD